MKKLILMCALGTLTAVSFTSCRKGYICTCTIAANGSDPAIVNKDEINAANASEARAKCKDKEVEVLGVAKTCNLE